MKEKSFLEELLRKKAVVEQIGTTTGKDFSKAVAEVDRQIRQCLTGDDIRRGNGVTKSGKED